MNGDLSGIYAAVVTPFDEKGRPAYDQFSELLKHLSAQGCHGVLVAGTTGEGPSLTVEERIGLFAAASQANANLRILAGTGATSLEDAKTLSRAAFEHGTDAIVVIPPFFYPAPSMDGLLSFYREILKAIPSDGTVLLYHNPFTTAPHISFELIERLVDQHGEQVKGIKDSSGDWSYTSVLLERFHGFQVFVGSDALLTKALTHGGSGGITALSGVFADLVRALFDAYQQGLPMAEAQARVDNTYRQFDSTPRIAAYKWLLAQGGVIKYDSVRPPLQRIKAEEIKLIQQRFNLNLDMPTSLDMANPQG